MKTVEQKYSTNKLKLLAVVWSCEFFRNYLLGNQFQVLPHHKATVTALTENRGKQTYQPRVTRWSERMLPFEYTIPHIAGAKIGVADNLTRSPKFEAPSTSKYDKQLVVKNIENIDEACRLINTPAENSLDYERVQLVNARQEKHSENTKKFMFDLNLSKRIQLATQSPEEGREILHRNFIQSNDWDRTASFDETFDIDGTSFFQSQTNMQMYIHPQEGALPCDFYISHLDQFTQIHIPRVQIGILRGKFFINQIKIFAKL